VGDWRTHIVADAAVFGVVLDIDLATVSGNGVAIVESGIAGFDAADAVIAYADSIVYGTWLVACATVGEIATRIHASSPIGDAFGISVDALIRTVAAIADRHRVGYPAVGAITIDEAAQTGAGAIAEARTTDGAIGFVLRYRRTADANRLDALIGIVGVDHIGIVVHGDDVARAVADVLLAVARRLVRCRGVRRLERHAAVAIDAGTDAAFVVGAWAVAGGETVHAVAATVADTSRT
jgi:hypothetical protein